MNRGAAHQDTFRDPDDREAFLELLGSSLSASGVELHAYCLMGNHYHLLVRTPRPSLDKLMQLLGSRYTRQFNARHHRDGALFRGRYRGLLIESEAYLLGVSRYIHRNPLELGVQHPADYVWSSYSSYISARRPQSWLNTDWTISLAGGESRYKAIVEAPLTTDVDLLFQQPRAPIAIGSPEFINGIASNEDAGRAAAA